MRWLCLVHLQARRRVWVHAPADSCLPRWLEGGSAVDPGSAVGQVLAVDPVSQGRRISHAPRIFPGQDLAGLEVWFQMASLRAAGPSRAPLRAPRIFPAQALAGREAWFQTASLGAAGITDSNCHRKFNLFLTETDRFYPQLRNVSSRGRDRRERDFLIFPGKALANQETERQSHLLTSSFGKIGVGRIRANWRIFTRTVPKIGITSVSSEII